MFFAQMLKKSLKIRFFSNNSVKIMIFVKIEKNWNSNLHHFQQLLYIHFDLRWSLFFSPLYQWGQNFKLMRFSCDKKNNNGKSKSCLEMPNSLIENARTSKFENVCFCGHPNTYTYLEKNYLKKWILRDVRRIYN